MNGAGMRVSDTWNLVFGRCMPRKMTSSVLNKSVMQVIGNYPTITLVCETFTNPIKVDKKKH